MASKRASRDEILQVRAAVSHAFPDCFAPKGGKKRPLKIGIVKELLAEARAVFPGISRRLIIAFLKDYTSGPRYHEVMVRGAARVDIRGNFAGFVTEREAAYASDRLRKLDQKRKPKRRDGELTPVGEAAKAVIEKAAQAAGFEDKLAKMRADLDILISEDRRCEMSDPFYYSNGRKDAAEREIIRLRAQISSLEAAHA